MDLNWKYPSQGKNEPSFISIELVERRSIRHTVIAYRVTYLKVSDNKILDWS